MQASARSDALVRAEAATVVSRSRPSAAAAAGQWVLLFAAVLSLGLLFQGSRGLWEPDEGFYANAALNMLESGDWALPRLNGEPFLDKPPLVYWSIAAGVRLLGRSEGAARAAHAFAFAATALLVGLLAGRWWSHRVAVVAALVYATSLAPFLAANVLTPDTLLALFSTSAYYAFWRLREAARGDTAIGWGAVLGVALGLGALAKGPAILVVTAPLAAFAALSWRHRKHRLRLAAYAVAALLALALAVPWYAYVCRRVPGAAAYLLDNQVTGRLVSARYGRNDSWSGGLAVYGPTLLLGSLPWTPLLVRRMWRARRQTGAGRRGARSRRPESVLLLVWLALPLAVFVTARSRLPLYVLPLFAPLALLAARPVAALCRLRRHEALKASLAVWIVALCALKLLLAYVPSRRDSRALAREMAAQGVPRSQLVICVDTKKNALSFYGQDHLEEVTLSSQAYPFFSPAESLAVELREMAEDGEPRTFVVSLANARPLRRALSAAGYAATSSRLSPPYVLLATAGRDALRAAAVPVSAADDAATDGQRAHPFTGRPTPDHLYADRRHRAVVRQPDRAGDPWHPPPATQRSQRCSGWRCSSRRRRRRGLTRPATASSACRLSPPSRCCNGKACRWCSPPPSCCRR